MRGKEGDTVHYDWSSMPGVRSIADDVERTYP